MCGFVEVRVWLSREVAGFVDKPFELLMTLHTNVYCLRLRLAGGGEEEGDGEKGGEESTA